MSRGKAFWARWKDLAHKAAVVQSNVLLWMLFYVIFVPVGLIRRPFVDPLEIRRARGWRERRSAPLDLKGARRQF